MWVEKKVDQAPQLQYTFFTKPTASKYTILEESAWAWTSKASILAM